MASEKTPLNTLALRIDEVDGLIVIGREAGRIKPLGLEATQGLKFVRDMSLGRWTSDMPLKIQAEPDWHHSCKSCLFEED